MVRLAIAIGTLIALPYLESIRGQPALASGPGGLLTLYPLVYGIYGIFLTFVLGLIPKFELNLGNSGYSNVVYDPNGVGRIESYGSSEKSLFSRMLPTALRLLLSLLWPVFDIVFQTRHILTAQLVYLRTGKHLSTRSGDYRGSVVGLLLLLALFLAGGVLIARQLGYLGEN